MPQLEQERRLFLTSVIATLGIFCARSVLGEENSKETRRAVARGARFLIESQRPSGAIADRGNDLAVTSLAILAIASADKTSEDAKRGIQSAIDFVLGNGHQDLDGYFGTSGGSMYVHGIATWMLGEVLRQSIPVHRPEAVRRSLRSGVDLIIKSHKAPKSDRAFVGGWRYSPKADSSDVSVTIWQLMALSSAKRAGIEVPDAVFESARSFVGNTYKRTETSKPRVAAGFSYTPSAVPSFGMTAAGLSSMQLCGRPDSEMAVSAADWLIHSAPAEHEFFFYAVFHYALAMQRAGGKYSQSARTQVSNWLMSSQGTDGVWISENGEKHYGNVYSTALAMIALSAGEDGP